VRTCLVLPLLAIACGGVEPELLFDEGERDVGYATVELTYPSAADGEDRVITVQVWYPADRGEAQAATYEVAGIVSVVSDGAYDAPEARLDGTAPLAIYSHGSGGQGLLGYPYGEHLASHGWVVMAPDHVGNTSLDATGSGMDPYVLTALNRPNDVSATLDAANDLVDGVTVDADHALVIGHSFGGYTALSVGGMVQDVDAMITLCTDVEDDPNCALVGNSDIEAAFRAGFRDERAVALVPQAPGLVSSAVKSSLADVDVPVLLQSGERDQTTPHVREAVPTWDNLDGEGDVWVNLPDGGHYTFVTVCDDLEPALVNLFIRGIDEDGCGEDFLPVSEAIPRLTATLHAFGNQHVLGEEGWTEALLEGGTEVWGAGLEISGRAE